LKACLISTLISKIRCQTFYSYYFVDICYRPSAPPYVLKTRPIQCKRTLTADSIFLSWCRCGRGFLFKICGLMRTQNFWICTSLVFVSISLSVFFQFLCWLVMVRYFVTVSNNIYGAFVMALPLGLEKNVGFLKKIFRLLGFLVFLGC